MFSRDGIRGAAAKQRETCRESVQRKASENLQCSRMSKLANETLDIFVQPATINEAWKSNLDMHLVKGTDWKRKNQPYSFKLWFWKWNNKWTSSGLKTKLSIFSNRGEKKKKRDDLPFLYVMELKDRRDLCIIYFDFLNKIGYYISLLFWYLGYLFRYS